MLYETTARRAFHALLTTSAFLCIASTSVAQQGQTAPAPVAPSTARQGSVVSLPGVVLTIRSNSQVRRLPTVDLPLSPHAKTRAYQIELTRGSVVVQVAEGQHDELNVSVTGDKILELPARLAPAHAVLVRSNNGEVAIVRRGRAIVRIDEGKLTVINYDADVLTGTAQKVLPLAMGHARSGSCKLGNGSRPLPKAPSFLLGDRVMFAVGNPVAPQLAWAASPNAARYRVRFMQRGTRLEVAALETGQTSLGIEAPHLEPGMYDAVVEPIDACGIEGPSTAEPLRIVGLELPAGSFIDEQGRVRLQPDQRIGFTNADGLLMRAQGSPTWFQAPQALTFQGDGEQHVFFSTSAKESPVALQMAPRNVIAEVKMGPTDVQWPEQPVTISIRLQDRTGGPAPAWLHAVPQVMLGTRPLDVKWQQDGATLRAVVPPQPGSGPCVLRVEVTDQFGLDLGRNFLEVERT